MTLFQRMRLAISVAIAPDLMPAQTILEIATAEKYECDIALLNAEAELERAHHTVEMLAERQTRLGEVIEAEIEAKKQRDRSKLPPAPAGFTTLGTGTISIKPVPRPGVKDPTFGEPLANTTTEARND